MSLDYTFKPLGADGTSGSLDAKRSAAWPKPFTQTREAAHFLSSAMNRTAENAAAVPA